ncbi:pSer/pThr/pTyr-binding forkhead associated (FHA) protein [Saccharopolyspora lacisalsi]|uniref:PSer/pThr/pTyr-binding forkhead associated (FHA) protein n=1 Tax=Halosaccharopolyspora lacisalsi TaxID=1000566 RepID=A0A839DVY7_9PSEU|nr:FHA domain-containing protein [Halosaccharopolyspora lacisalsi]MBA8824929.1 pSer/pThr/pTyr-binding forkhead associated (FHA) protein [Halosaccharopolyspora lacisalsi]
MNDTGIDVTGPVQEAHQPPTPLTQESETVAAPAPRALPNTTRAELVPTRGDRTGTGITLANNRTTIGRARDCDIVLDDVTISRHHAELHHTDRDHTLVDIGALNGTYLNRHPLTQQTELVDGDEIWIGKARFTFHRPARLHDAHETAGH